ncbi:MAG: pseudouridine synthase [Terriglobia bacterium]
MAERLQKLIARAGLASRRTAEAWILSGRVRVNGRVVTTLGSKADPAGDRIEVDGSPLRFPRAHAYLMLHKPRGTLTTAADTQRGRTLSHLLRRVPQRVFSVGRLPYRAEGLLLLTSDGTFAAALLRAHLPQTFWLKVKGRLSREEEAKLVRIAQRRGERSFSWKQVKRGPNPWYEAVLSAPQQDWLRAWLFHSGHPVEKLKRVAVGRLALGDLPAGAFRVLSETERRHLLTETRRSCNVC